MYACFLERMGALYDPSKIKGEPPPQRLTPLTGDRWPVWRNDERWTRQRRPGDLYA